MSHEKEKEGEGVTATLDEDDDDSIAVLFENIDDLSLDHRLRGDGDDDGDDDVAPPRSAAASSSRTANTCDRRKLRQRGRGGGSSKSRHSLDHLRGRVSRLMSIFEERGLFVPLPDAASSRKGRGDPRDDDPHGGGKKKKKKKGGKVWSNRNYGADKKRQRKEGERLMLEGRIAQLESILVEEHGVHVDDMH